MPGTGKRVKACLQGCRRFDAHRYSGESWLVLEIVLKTIGFTEDYWDTRKMLVAFFLYEPERRTAHRNDQIRPMMLILANVKISKELLVGLIGKRIGFHVIAIHLN